MQDAHWALAQPQRGCLAEPWPEDARAPFSAAERRMTELPGRNCDVRHRMVKVNGVRMNTQLAQATFHRARKYSSRLLTVGVAVWAVCHMYQWMVSAKSSSWSTFSTILTLVQRDDFCNNQKLIAV